jgi:CheY-like chemotaxis protein
MKREKRPNEVVIIDDDPDICEALASAVMAEGCRAAMFTRGREALRYVRDLVLPGLVLVDVAMPELDGWGFLEELGRDPGGESVPAFLMSADTNLCADRASRLNARGVLKKPFDLADLLGVIHLHCVDPDERTIRDDSAAGNGARRVSA